MRVITTRYQDAVPFYLENGFAQAGATAANAVVKGWTEKGGKVLYRSRPVPIKQIIVSAKMPAGRAAEDPRRAPQPARPQGRLEPGTVGYKGFVRAQSGSRELDDLLARACSNSDGTHPQRRGLSDGRSASARM